MKAKQNVGMVLMFVAALTACDDDKDNKPTYALDAETSVVEWHGAGAAAQHDGSFAVESNNLTVVDNRLISGSFEIPIASIKNFDLPDDLKPVLLNHLKSVDFFDMATYPTASFEITQVTDYTGDDGEELDDANVKIKGNFTMIGKTMPIEFPARVTFSGSSLEAEAILTIDRTDWGMDYSADPDLGEHYIYPDVDLHLKLKGSKK